MLLAGLFVLALGVFTVVHVVPASHDALQAKSHLLQAEQSLSSRDLATARTQLVAAQGWLQKMKHQLGGLGPIVPAMKVVPVVGWQVKAVDTFRSAGTTLTDAGLRLADAAQAVTDTNKGSSPLSGVLDELRTINASLASGAASVRKATKAVQGLKGDWLIGPIGSARDDLLKKLPHYEQEATNAADGVSALIQFAGGGGDRRYLFLSQNPEELRPTGGFIGTYGVLSAVSGQLSLDQFQPINQFKANHPDAVVPAGQAGSPFQFAVPPQPQTFANVNNTADFPKAAALAVQLWNGSGEKPVNGVVSFTPAFLARILGAIGPVDVVDYNEHITEANLIDRFDYYTEQVLEDPNGNGVRHAFVSSLAQAVMNKLLQTPSSSWQALATAVGQGFAAREAMAWSSDKSVASTLTERGWDGNLPTVTGDFFYNGEFSYASKVDRSYQRTFEHQIQLRDDGSGTVTTTMTLVNPSDPSGQNLGSLAYVTIYGPAGATLDPASDKPVATEPAVGGHPAEGYFLNAPPYGKATLKVVWDVKNLAKRGPNGTWVLSMDFLRVPDHSGDVLNLNVQLPAGWTWKGAGPKPRYDLTQDIRATWVASSSG